MVLYRDVYKRQVLVIFHRHPDKQDETTEKPEEKSHEEN